MKVRFISCLKMARHVFEIASPVNSGVVAGLAHGTMMKAVDEVDQNDELGIGACTELDMTLVEKFLLRDQENAEHAPPDALAVHSAEILT